MENQTVAQDDPLLIVQLVKSQKVMIEVATAEKASNMAENGGDPVIEQLKSETLN